MEDQKQIRCAIYTRKSTDEGLEKEFNTLEAQREAGENFVMSMKHQGWVILPDHYDDSALARAPSAKAYSRSYATDSLKRSHGMYPYFIL